MRKIRILSTIASSEGWSFNPGVVVDVGERFVTDKEVPADYAEKWVNGGVIAEWVRTPKAEPEVVAEEETATLPDAPERAVARRGRRKRN